MQLTDSRQANEAKFERNFAQKKKEIADAMKTSVTGARSKENPELQNESEPINQKDTAASSDDAPLSFRERLMRKNSLAKEFLSSLKNSHDKALKKAKLDEKKNRNLS